MENTDWVILDTEITGFSAPVFVVELAAQKMKGWEPEGPPFKCLLNHGTRPKRCIVAAWVRPGFWMWSSIALNGANSRKVIVKESSASIASLES